MTCNTCPHGHHFYITYIHMHVLDGGRFGDYMNFRPGYRQDGLESQNLFLACNWRLVYLSLEKMKFHDQYMLLLSQA